MDDRNEITERENVKLRIELAAALIKLSEPEEKLERQRPVIEAARAQYDAAGDRGWIGAWWFNPRFQQAAIDLHVALEKWAAELEDKS